MMYISEAVVTLTEISVPVFPQSPQRQYLNDVMTASFHISSIILFIRVLMMETVSIVEKLVSILHGATSQKSAILTIMTRL